MTVKDKIKELDKIINSHLFFSHQFILEFSSKKLSKNQLKKFALSYYAHIFNTRLYQANTLGITSDENIQAVFANILYDEYGNGDIKKSHLSLYRRFLNSLDINEYEAKAYPIFKEQQNYINNMARVTQSENWLFAIGAAGIAGEWPIPRYYSLLLNGLKYSSFFSEDSLELFSSHIDIDIDHSNQLTENIKNYLNDKNSYEKIKHGIIFNLDQRVMQLNGLYREVFI